MPKRRTHTKKRKRSPELLEKLRKARERQQFCKQARESAFQPFHCTKKRSLLKRGLSKRRLELVKEQLLESGVELEAEFEGQTIDDMLENYVRKNHTQIFKP